MGFMKRRGLAGLTMLVFAGLAGLLACSKPAGPPQVHALPELTSNASTRLPSGQSVPTRDEYFVVSNAPTSRAAFLALVKAYNAKTVTPAMLQQHYAHFRMFYRESRDLPRDYKEANRGYFDKEFIGKHVDDLVLVVKWIDYGKEEVFEFQPQATLE